MNEPTNHEEASQYAEMHPESNLARCYLHMKLQIRELQAANTDLIRFRNESVEALTKAAQDLKYDRDGWRDSAIKDAKEKDDALRLNGELKAKFFEIVGIMQGSGLDKEVFAKVYEIAKEQAGLKRNDEVTYKAAKALADGPFKDKGFGIEGVTFSEAKVCGYHFSIGQYCLKQQGHEGACA